MRVVLKITQLSLKKSLIFLSRTRSLSRRISSSEAPHVCSHISLKRRFFHAGPPRQVAPSRALSFLSQMAILSHGRPVRTLSHGTLTPALVFLPHTRPLARSRDLPFSRSQTLFSTLSDAFHSGPQRLLRGPQNPSHPLCRNDSSGEKGRFLCAVPETLERLPGACQEVYGEIVGFTQAPLQNVLRGPSQRLLRGLP